MRKVVTCLSLLGVLGLVYVSYVKLSGGCLLCKWDNPFFVENFMDNLDFASIREDHYLPAVKEGLKDARAEINSIVSNKEPATFDNVIVPLEYGARLLDRTISVFYNLSSTIATPTTQKLEEEITGLLSEYENEVNFNKALFAKIKTVYEKRHDSELTPEQIRVVELYYDSFRHRGVDLDDKTQEELKKINIELSNLSTKFANNLLDEARLIGVEIKDPKELDGLPESFMASFKAQAEAKKKEGYFISGSKPDVMAVLSYCKNPDTRKKAFDLYTGKGAANEQVVLDMVNLRIKRANLMGYPNHASYTLSFGAMADKPELALDLMERVWAPALETAKKEKKELQDFARRTLNDASFKLQAWDWFYWAEQYKKAQFDLDPEELSSYFELTAVRNGLFEVLSRLYSLKFTRIQKSVYHPDVEVYSISNSETGEYIGDLYLDYYTREGKNAGAWMNEFRSEYITPDSKLVTPIVINVFNFPRVVEGKPSLLSLEDVTTFFHEVGHSVHGLLSKCRYPLISGTSVARDFVEFPSQFMENWATHKDVLPLYAKHYKTGEPMSQKMIDQIHKMSSYGKGFEKTEYISAALLDFRWHLLTQPLVGTDVKTFEKEVLDSYGLIPEIHVRYSSTYFLHMFSHGYDAKYYSYLWSEVLDADAFSLFEESGVFNKTLSTSFRDNILSRGNSEDPKILYKKFRGSDPDETASMRRWGFLK